jgi:hypothetical protein
LTIDILEYILYLQGKIKRILTQNQDKMKTKLNIALEGTCSGDVVGGLLSWTGEVFRRFLFVDFTG